MRSNVNLSRIARAAGWARAGYDADDRDPSVGRAFTDEDLARIVE